MTTFADTVPDSAAFFHHTRATTSIAQQQASETEAAEEQARVRDDAYIIDSYRVSIQFNAGHKEKASICSHGMS